MNTSGSSDSQGSRLATPMPAGELLGITVNLEVPGRVVCELVIADDHLNQALMPHGGVLFALADTSLGLLVNRPGETTWVGTSFTLQLYRAARVGDTLRATATLEHQSRSLTGCRVLIDRERDSALIGTLTTQLLRAPAPTSAPTASAHAITVRWSAGGSSFVRALRAARQRELTSSHHQNRSNSNHKSERHDSTPVVYVDAQPVGYMEAVREEAPLQGTLWIHPRWRHLEQSIRKALNI